MSDELIPAPLLPDGYAKEYEVGKVVQTPEGWMTYFLSPVTMENGDTLDFVTTGKGKPRLTVIRKLP